MTLPTRPSTRLSARLRARIRAGLDGITDRIHNPADERARAAGLTVERLPDGRRRISDPRLPVYLERRRQRIARTGGDALDRALGTNAGTDRPDPAPNGPRGHTIRSAPNRTRVRLS